jgi:hypothetical protein
MLLDSYKVTAATTDITNMVMGMTFYESINGLLKGNIQMLDGASFFDIVIGEHDKLCPVEIEFNYLANEPTIIQFMIDGVNQMKIFKAEKSYTMHLITLEEFNLKLNDINEVYNGPAEEIVASIYKQSMGQTNRLIINTLSTTKGKYVVPNISALEAIANTTYAAVDSNYTGFYFYQRLYDQGSCRFGSLYSMSIDFHKRDDGEIMKISNADISLKELNDNDIMSEGSASIFELEEYRMHHSDKLARGEYGHKIHHIELDKTNLKKNEPIRKNQTQVEITKHKISEFIYGRPITIPPGPHSDEEPETYEQKSLFHDVDSPNTQAAVNLKKRIYNNTLNVSNMVPAAYMGVGQSIHLELGRNTPEEQISEGAYIVADINHIFTIQDSGAGMDYVQNVKLLREYA